MAGLDDQIAAAAAATIQGDLAQLQAQQSEAQRALAAAAATPAPLPRPDGSQAVYTLAGADGFTAVTHSWTVRVTLDGQTADHLTVLTYALIHG